MKKSYIHVLSAFVAIIIIPIIFSVVAVAEETENRDVFTYGDYTYSLKDKDATIVKYNGEDKSVDIPAVIPTEDGITDYIVVSIGKNAFKNGKFQSVTIPDSVKTIEAYAFSDSELSNIKIGKSVEFIGDYCFEACYNISRIELPDSLKTIGRCAFLACKSIKSITFGANLESVGLYAFGGCTVLEEVFFYPKLKSIGAEAFKDCENLYKAIFDCDAPEIGENAFSGVNEIFKIYYAECAKGWDSRDLSVYPMESVSMHVYGKWKIVTEPTQVNKGLEKHICTGCGNVETRDIAKLLSGPDTETDSSFVPYIICCFLIVVMVGIIITYFQAKKKQSK